MVGQLARLLPGAQVHTSVADVGVLPEALAPEDVTTSMLQPLRRRGMPLAVMAPLLPGAIARLRLEPARVVLSSTSAFAHHATPPPGAVHIAYVHSPPHFLWEPGPYFADRRWLGRAAAPVLAWLRRLDRTAVARVHTLVANSAYTAERIERAYGRRAVVLHPPVEIGRFAPSPHRSGRYLVVARLRRHKRLEVALEASRRMGVGLDVIGDGPDETYLRSVAGPTVRFLGRLDDQAVAEAMAGCIALVVPGVEDFGLTMAEVQAAGRPVVAFARGGALEIVEDGVTGFLVPHPGVDALVDGMARAMATELDQARLVASAARFDTAVFMARLRGILEDAAVDAGAAGGA